MNYNITNSVDGNSNNRSLFNDQQQENNFLELVEGKNKNINSRALTAYVEGKTASSEPRVRTQLSSDAFRQAFIGKDYLESGGGSQASSNQSTRVDSDTKTMSMPETLSSASLSSSNTALFSNANGVTPSVSNIDQFDSLNDNAQNAVAQTLGNSEISEAELPGALERFNANFAETKDISQAVNAAAEGLGKPQNYVDLLADITQQNVEDSQNPALEGFVNPKMAFEQLQRRDNAIEQTINTSQVPDAQKEAVIEAIKNNLDNLPINDRLDGYSNREIDNATEIALAGVDKPQAYKDNLSDILKDNLDLVAPNSGFDPETGFINASNQFDQDQMVNTAVEDTINQSQVPENQRQSVINTINFLRNNLGKSVERATQIALVNVDKPQAYKDMLVNALQDNVDAANNPADNRMINPTTAFEQSMN